MTLEKIYESWLNEKQWHVKTSSMRAYSYLMEHYILPELGNENNITAAYLQQFLNECSRKGLSRNSINGILSVIHMVMAYGSEKGWCRRADEKVVIPKTTAKKSLSTFNARQAAILIQHLTSSRQLLDTAILMSITTGMRLGEVCGLQYGDLLPAFHQCVIHRTVSVAYNHHTHHTFLTVTLPKTIHSQRNIPLHKSVEEILMRLRMHGQKKVDCYIFSNSRNPLHPNALRKHYQHTLQQLGLPVLRFHALRHTFATQCIASGCDVKTLSAILGHSNVQTTFNLYVHPSMEQKQKCLDNMMDYVLQKDI